MDFNFTQEQIMFRDSVRKFAEIEMAPGVAEREDSGGFGEKSWDAWKKMSEFGLVGLSIPSEYGGGEADALTTVIALEAFARGSRDLSMCVVWGSHLLLTAMPIVELGTVLQKEKYLAKMATGEWMGAFALTEPEAGSDATSLKTTAVKKGNTYVLNGSKTFISNAPIADVFLVFATIDPSLKAKGITIFIVGKNSPGVSLGKPLKKYDGDGSPTGEIFFEDCVVPAENLLGREGEGFSALLMSLGWERIAFAPSIGLMEANLNLCIEYSKERKQFGKPIGKYQLVQAMLAEMKMDLDASRYLVYHLAWMKDNQQFIGLDAAIAKTFVTEAAERSASKAVQIFGGYGCMREYEVGRSLWFSKIATIGGGTSQIQRTIIGRLLTGL